jgi:hypothetical protein
MLGCFLSVTLASVSCIVKGYCRTQVCPDQRMRRFKARRQLRQEQGGEEKPMARQLDHTRFAFPINAGALQRSAQYPGTKDWVEAEVAAKLFRCLCNTIRVMHLRPSCEPYRLRLPHKREDQAMDEQGGSVRCCFLMVCILQLEHVACILDQSMLETASGAEKGPVPLAGELNPSQGSFHADIWAARSRPQSVTGIEELKHRASIQCTGGKP